VLPKIVLEYVFLDVGIRSCCFQILIEERRLTANVQPKEADYFIAYIKRGGSLHRRLSEENIQRGVECEVKRMYVKKPNSRVWEVGQLLLKHGSLKPSKKTNNTTGKMDTALYENSAIKLYTGPCFVGNCCLSAIIPHAFGPVF